MNLAVHIALTDTAGNQLIVLAAEVQNQNVFSHNTVTYLISYLIKLFDYIV